MSASKICESHTAVGEIHAAFAAVTSPPRETLSVCKRYLDAWLDHADNGVFAEPIRLEFLVKLEEPAECRCHATPLPPCGACENGATDV